MIQENNRRKKQFQLKTVLHREQKTIFKASSVESDGFLKSIIVKFKKLHRDELITLNFNKILDYKKNKVFFEFIDGKTFEEMINNDLTQENISYYFDRYITIINLFNISSCSEVEGNRVQKIFGKASSLLNKNDDYLKSGILDVIMSNIILDAHDNVHIIDYEWTFDFPIHKKYVIWRAIYGYLYTIYGEKKIDHKSLYKRYKKQLKISMLQEFIFLNMEYSFQKYVQKEHPHIFSYYRVFYIMTLFRFSRFYKQ